MKKSLLFLFFLTISGLTLGKTYGGKPDLKPALLKIQPLEPRSPRFRVFLKISNEGEQCQQGFVVVLEVLNSHNQWVQAKKWKLSGMPGHAIVKLTTDLTLKKMPERLRIVVDALKQVDEVSEDNNILELSTGYITMGNLQVTVTAPRMEIPLRELPAATSVVGPDNLQSMPRTISADEALSLVPGVKVENQANGERVHIYIRGQGILSERGIRGIKILLDGLPLNDPTGFAPDLYDVDWATVEKIEVLRGPSASLYGGGASGGIINIITKDGGEGKLGFSGLLSAGSYGFYKSLISLGGTSGNFNYRISASRTQGDGYREHTRFWGNNVYGKFGWSQGRVRLTGIMAWTEFYNDNAEGLNLEWLRENRRMANPDALLYNEYQKTRRFTVGLTGEIDLRENQNFTFSLFYRKTHYDESVPSSLDHRIYGTPGAIFQYQIRWEKGKLINTISAGLETEWQVINEYRHPNLGGAVEGPQLLSDQNILQRNLGVYIIDRMELGNHWSVVFNLRHDYVYNRLEDRLKAEGIDRSGKASFRKNTFKIGISWNPISQMGFYANWGTGFLPPSTEELENNPDALGGFNTHLKPSFSYGGEFGIRGYLSNSIFFDVAVFHIKTENDFGRYRIPSRPLETFYRNIGKTSRYGMETLLAWYPFSGASFQMAYTYSNYKYTSFIEDDKEISGTYLPNSPVHMFSADASVDISRRVGVGIGIYAQSRSYVDPENKFWIDGYYLLNARLVFRLSSRLQLMLYGRNILNREYIAFTEPDPDGNSYQPGPTREVFLSLRFR